MLSEVNMMTREDSRALAAEWHRNDHHIIMVCRVPFDSWVRCELCERSVAALPESAEKCKAEDWHLICVQCVGNYFTGFTKKFMGRFSDSATARRVLSK